MTTNVLTAEYEKLVKELFKETANIYGRDLADKWINDHIVKARDGCQTLNPLLAEMKKSGKHIRMLDMCCGWGEYVVNFCCQGIDCYGMDISEDPFNGLTLARENNLQNHFIQGNVDYLSLKSSIFDIVCLFSALEHIKRPQKMFNNVYRTLKPGGLFYITFPNPLHPVDGHTLLRFVPYMPHSLAEIYVKLRKKRQRKDIWDVWYHKRCQVYNWANKAGFKNITAYPPNRFLGKNLKNNLGYKKLVLDLADRFNINLSKYRSFTSNMISLLMEKTDTKSETK